LDRTAQRSAHVRPLGAHWIADTGRMMRGTIGQARSALNCSIICSVRA
jgi:hypothetical protein